MPLFLLSLTAMLFFAANSVLCRLALLETAMPPEAYTFVRLFSGAVTLGTVMLWQQKNILRHGSWPAATALFLYMAFFSWGYVGISTAAGTLVIAFAVQSSMLLLGLHKGEYPTARQYGGIALALGGLVCLLLPGLSAPSPGDSLLMLVSGVSWGVYCFCGRRNSDPAAATAGNFLRALPLAALTVLVWPGLKLPTLFQPHAGLAYAVTAGAVASALGYIIWYAVVPRFTLAKAAVVQLSVPVFTAVGGLLFVGEAIDARMAVSSALILGGIFLTMVSRAKPL